MAGTNAVGQARRHWGVMPPLPAPFLVEAAKQAEASGMEGLFATQVYGPPFVTLGAVAAVTERLKIASGIAIAAVRSPFETAMAAIDLDRISMGRFTLGLGSSISAWTSGVFGTPDYKPLDHMRETVAAVRHIIKGAHCGLQPFHGTYFKADFKELQPMQPPVRDEIPIWIAALREKLACLAAEIGDGVIGHPMWSVEWTLNEMKPAIEGALAKAGRKRSDLEVSIWPWVAPNPDEAEALNDSRPTIAFYGGAKQYESFFAAHGFLKEARLLQEGVQRGDYLSVAHLVPDEMVRAFVATGDLDKVRERIEPIWGFADSMCMVPPAYNLTPEKQLYYQGQIAQLIASR